MFVAGKRARFLGLRVLELKRRRLVDAAKQLGEIAREVDAGQLAFEVTALLNYANDRSSSPPTPAP